MQDGLTAPLAKITQTSGIAKSALGRLTESNKELRSMSDQSGKSVNELKSRIAKLQEYRDILPPSAESKIRGINSEINQLNKHLQKMQTMNGSKVKVWFKDAFDSLPQFARNPLVAIGVAAGSAINEGMKRSKEKLDFKLLLGENAGAEVYSGAKKMKRFYGDDAMVAGKKLAQAGVNSGDVSPMLERIGKIASGDAGKFNALTEAFAGVKKEGKLTEATLVTMAANGFKPLTILQQRFGQDMSYWQKQLADGEIDVDMVTKAFMDAADKGGIFANTLKEIDGSPTGLWNRLTTGVKDVAGIIGDLLMPVITPVMQLMNYGLDKAIAGFSWLQKLIEDNQDTLSVFGSIVLGAAGGWAVYQGWVRLAWMWQMRDLVATALLTTLKGAQASVISGLIVAWNGLTAAMMANPIGAIIAGVVAVIGGIVLLATKFEWARKIVYGVWEVFKAVAKNIATFFQNLFGGGNKKYLAIDVAYKKGADEASAEFAAKKQGLGTKTEEEKLLEKYLKTNETPGNKDAKTEAGINAVSGGGAKSYTINIGKVIERYETRIMGNSNDVMNDFEIKVEEAIVRIFGSLPGRI